jgi:hypothetical protein
MIFELLIKKISESFRLCEKISNVFYIDSSFLFEKALFLKKNNFHAIFYPRGRLE